MGKQKANPGGGQRKSRRDKSSAGKRTKTSKSASRGPGRKPAAKAPGKTTAKRTSAQKRSSARKSAAKKKPTARKASTRRSATGKRKGTTKAAPRKTAARRPAAKKAAAGGAAAGKPARVKAAKSARAGRTTKSAVARTARVTGTGSAKAKARKPRTAKAATRPRLSMPKAPKAAARAARKTKKPSRKTPAVGIGARKAPPVKPPVEAYRGAKPYIFASYSHENMREVFSVIKKLSGSRYRIWYDEGVEPGNEWPEEVGKALLGCSQFIVFMSRSAADSRNVRNEINLATGEDKNVLVVFLEPTDLSEGMRLQIGTVQFLNRHEMTETEFVDKLKKVLSVDLKN